MRKIKNALLALAGTAAFLASCTTVDKTAQTVSIDAQIYQHPTVAVLQAVDERASAETEWVRTPLSFGHPSLEQMKQNLVAELVEQAGADVLLDVEYTYKRRLIGRCKLVVTGYPAKFGEFRKATPADLAVLKNKCPERKRGIYNVSQPWYKRLLPFKMKKS